MKSVMKHDFSRVPAISISRSTFDRSHGGKDTFQSGKLVPFLVDEILPGDTVNLNAKFLARLATPLHPFMDNVFLDTQFFFVPERLIWKNFVKMMGEQDNPGDSTDYQFPILKAADDAAFSFANDSLADHFGLPTDVNFTSADHIRSGPFLAYNLIYNTWYRDENLQNSVYFDTGDGPHLPSNFVLLDRGKRHDYFTSCLPFPQKGADVYVPVGSSAPLIVDSTSTDPAVLRNATTHALYPPSSAADYLQSAGAGGQLEGNAGGVNLILDPQGSIIADLSSALGSTVNQFREAMQMQVYYEQLARGGSRYIEYVKNIFGVTSSDARFNRPEYLGGGSTRLNVHPIASTSSFNTPSADPDALRPVGELGATASFFSERNGFSKSFEEHGWLIGLMSVRADLTYQQGLHKKFTRQDDLDLYIPAFSQLGEQAVLNKEIYCQGQAAGDDDDDVFGYQERYAEYRYFPSQIKGQFRSNFATTLDSWHLAQDFANLPVLGDEFIKESPPIDRVIALTANNYPQFICDYYIDYKHARPMPTYGIPASLGRF